MQSGPFNNLFRRTPIALQTKQLVMFGGANREKLVPQIVCLNYFAGPWLSRSRHRFRGNPLKRLFAPDCCLLFPEPIDKAVPRHLDKERSEMIRVMKST